MSGQLERESRGGARGGLRERGDLRDPKWTDAVAAAPRRVFVPEVWEQDSSAGSVDLSSPGGSTGLLAGS